MATTILNQQGYPYTINATGLYILGIANASGVGSMVWQTTGSTWVGSFKVKKRVLGGTLDARFVVAQCAREGSTSVHDADEALAFDDIYVCFADGCMVALDITVTSGTLELVFWGGKG